MEEINGQFREIFSKSPIGILFYDKYGKLTNANQSALEIFCIPSLDDFRGLNLFDNPHVASKKEELIKNGLVKFQAPLDLDNIKWAGFYTPTKSGIVFIDWTVSVIDSGFLVQVLDITEHEKAEKELKEGLARFHSLYENSFDAILLTKPDGIILAANPAAQKMFDRTEEEIIKAGRKGIVVENKQLESALEERAKKGKAEAELIYRKKDGSTFPGETTSSLFMDADGTVKTSMIIRDITERKKAEKALKESERKFKSLYSSMTEGVAINKVLYDSHDEAVDYIIIDTNPAYENIIGLKRSEFIGKKASQLYGTGKPIYMDIYARVAETGEPALFEAYFESMNRYFRIMVSSPEKGIFATFFEDITKRKQIEEELKQAHERLEEKVQERTLELQNACNYLKESESKFKSLAENSPGLIIRLDKDLRYVYVNSVITKITGKSPEDYIGKTYDEAGIPGEYAALWGENNLKALETGEIQHYEFEFHTPNGLKFIESTAIPEFNDNGEIDSLLILDSDITGRKNFEEKLQNALNEISDLYNNAPCGYHSLDKDGYFVKINDTELNWLGYSREEIIGKKKFTDLITEESINVFEKNFPGFKERGNIYNLEFDMVRKDGSILPVDLNATTITDSDGNYLRSRSTIFDIAKRKEAENQIKKQNKILNGINHIFKEVLTVETEEELGKTCLAVCEDITCSEFGLIEEVNDGGTLDAIAMSDPGWSKCRIPFSNAVKLIKGMKIHGLYGGVIKLEKPVITNDPALNPNSAGIPEGHPHLTAFLGVPLKYSDKTIGLIGLANKKLGYTHEDQEIVEALSVAIAEALMGFRAKNTLKDTLKKLEQSNEELQQFAYVSSHDLQEPLRTIASFTQLLERRYKGRLDSDADEFIEYIVDAAVRMKQQIQDLLEYSRVTTAEKEFKQIDTDLILNQAISNLKNSIDENNAEITHDPLPELVADGDQMRRVFQNLIGNAIKYRKPDKPPKIHISAHENKESHEYVFSVSDNGIGIEKQYLDRIFRIFQRLHTIDEYKGTGVGLAVVKRVIELHGGRIWVESELGRGSTFYFTIPISKDV